MSNLYGSYSDRGELKVNMLKLAFRVNDKLDVSYKEFKDKVDEFDIITNNQLESIELAVEYFK